MIRQLVGRKLIEVRKNPAGEDVYKIHRLLQRKIIINIGMELKFDSAMRKATRLVRKQFPGASPIQAPLPKQWPTCQKLMPHVHSLWKAYKDAEVDYESFEKTEELARLFYDAGFYVWDRPGAEYDGLGFLDKSEAILDSLKVEENHRLRADIHCMSGLLRNPMGCEQRDESLRRLRLARDIRAYQFELNPTRDNDVLLQNANTDLGILLLNSYEFREAEELFEGCLVQYRKWDPVEDNIPFEYSKYYYNAGIVRMWQKRLNEALDFLQRSVSLAERAFGKEGQFWDNLFMLACVTAQTGDLDRSLELHREVLDAKNSQFGRHSRTTILSTYAVGSLYAALNQPDEAW